MPALTWVSGWLAGCEVVCLCVCLAGSCLCVCLAVCISWLSGCLCQLSGWLAHDEDVFQQAGRGGADTADACSLLAQLGWDMILPQVPNQLLGKAPGSHQVPGCKVISLAVWSGCLCALLSVSTSVCVWWRAARLPSR